LGWKTSKAFDFPVICVGNLSTGGTGKTPTIEYLIRLLRDQYSVATLSRGYKRDTKGFILANDHATAKTIGDEPFQFYRKFKDAIVAVDADRRRGISEIIKLNQADVILLDDAFQHRSVKANLNILLTSYGNLYTDDIVLPTGNLREPRAGAKRANIILVTKCPPLLSDSEKGQIRKKLNPLAHQHVYFSSISYSDTILNENKELPLSSLIGKKVSLVTGIANPEPLINYLKSKSVNFEHLNFEDHHVFSASEINVLKEKEIILTTEKDYVRLQGDFKSNISQLWYIPISFEIDEAPEFNAHLLSFMSSVLN